MEVAGEGDDLGVGVNSKIVAWGDGGSQRAGATTEIEDPPAEKRKRRPDALLAQKP